MDIIIYSEDPKIKPKILKVDGSKWSFPKYININDKDLSKTLFIYAQVYVKKRWIEAEEFIKKDPILAYYYALNIIKGRWLEAEEFIIKNPWTACHYAIYIIKDRWPEAEKTIKEDPLIWSIYRNQVWPLRSSYIIEM